MALRLRRGTDLERLTIVPAAGELIYTTDTKKLYIGDGSITGGNEVSTEIKGLLADDLYLSTYKLLGSGLELDGLTGNITANMITGDLLGSVFANDSTKLIDSTLGKIIGPIEVSINDVSILGGNAGQVLTTDGAGNLTWTYGSGGGASVLSDLSDVSIGSLNNNEVLTWNGSAWVNAAVTPSGHFVGDISGSVFADDSTTLVNGVTGTISNGVLTFIGDTIYSNSSYVSQNDVVINKIKLGLDSQITHNFSDPETALSITNAITAGYSGVIKRTRLSRNTIDSPSIVQAGDYLCQDQYMGHDGIRYVNSSTIAIGVDPNGTVGSYAIPGIIYFANFIDGDLNNPIAMSFDSRGRLAVNKVTADQELDVNGNGKFSGFVQFGSLSATQRGQLTPANGMVIYNSTANRFQGYQAGAWINLDDGTSAA